MASVVDRVTTTAEQDQHAAVLPLALPAEPDVIDGYG